MQPPGLKRRELWPRSPTSVHLPLGYVAQFCPTLCDPMDCSPPGSSVHGILQARIMEWVAMPSSRGSSQLRDQTHVFYVSCTGRQAGSLPLAPRKSETKTKRNPSIRENGGEQCWDVKIRSNLLFIYILHQALSPTLPPLTLKFSRR